MHPVSHWGMLTTVLQRLMSFSTGSDLDGDEYAVIWDENLMLERNEEAFDYTAEKPQAQPINPATMKDDMVDFYIKYITQDSVGTISNSFLFQADLYGINSEVCLRLAKKISQAVDFTKTGLPPKPLVKDWTHGCVIRVDDETGKDIPPEKSERQPDFHFGNDFDPIYQSPRLMGRIYRFVHAIMENYGIKTEGEVFSGCISEMRNRISDKDQDDMTFYNTNEVIEKRVTTLYARFRTEFFLGFGGYEICTIKMDKKFATDSNIFHRLVHNPTLEMKQKAVAYYRVCYETAQATREKILSFGWIAFDVLARVRQENVMKELDVIPTTTPIYEMLKKIFDVHTENNPKFARFSKFSSNEAAYQLKKYTTHYEGLSRVMYIVSEWAERNQLFEGRLQSHHICLILILYGIGLIPGSMNRDKPLMDKVDDEDDGVDVMDDDHQVQLFLGFFEYLASRAFRKLPYLRFDYLGYAAVFLRGEWLPLNQAAVKTYYNLVFNHRFDEMKENPYDDATYGAIVRECEPFVIELPENVDTDKDERRIIEKAERRIIEKAGVEEVLDETMEKMHLRVTMLHEFKLRHSVSEATQNIKMAWREDSANERTVRRWYQKFRVGDVDLEDKDRSGRPAKCDDRRLKERVEADSRITVREMGREL
ncbi:unnamed protein product, partial [Heligmosomoides polygyrus]|uniref:RNA-dependent RNA polymerase n=1 Tax=Heligmosomoides polygyrus TaxID=6339 RepID=A0A183F482_HELPZ